MITKEKVIALTEQRIKGTDIFLVEVAVKPGNVIRVQLDRPEGITIDQCVEISRYLNGSMDREEEDFSLEVSSPGIGAPFRVKQQYEKNTGHRVEVVLTDGNRLEGTLQTVSDGGIVLVAGKKEMPLTFDQIKRAKEIINFS
jgi:ribosome maturation factor RimP